MLIFVKAGWWILGGPVYYSMCLDSYIIIIKKNYPCEESHNYEKKKPIPYRIKIRISKLLSTKIHLHSYPCHAPNRLQMLVYLQIIISCLISLKTKQNNSAHIIFIIDEIVICKRVWRRIYKLSEAQQSPLGSFQTATFHKGTTKQLTPP